MTEPKIKRFDEAILEENSRLRRQVCVAKALLPEIEIYNREAINAIYRGFLDSAEADMRISQSKVKEAIKLIWDLE